MARAAVPGSTTGDLLTSATCFVAFIADAGPLASVEDQNPDTHEFRPSAHDAANFDLVYDGNKPTSVVYSRCDPTMSLWDVAKVDAVVTKRHGVIGALAGRFANKLD